MDLFRSARDKSLIEVEERQKAEAALKLSEERHALLAGKIIAAQEEERTRLSVELHDELGQILTAIRLEMGKDIALCTYRILQESLTNIRKHSMAANVNISTVYNSTGLELSVSDDGVGSIWRSLELCGDGNLKECRNGPVS